MNKEIVRLLGVAMLALVLAGCGGGSSDSGSNNNGNNDSNTNGNNNNGNNDDSNGNSNGDGNDNVDPVVAKAEGLFRGTTDDGRDLLALLLGDDTFWVLYTAPDSSELGGGIQGVSGLASGTFTSSQGRDFHLGTGMREASISASYSAETHFDGTVTFEGGEALTFETAYDDSYKATPSIALVAGSHGGRAYTVDGSLPTSLTIAEDGTLTGVRGTCSISGTVAPRTDGNAYDITVSFDGALCVVMGASVKGVALIDSESGLLRASALNSDRTVGFIYTEEDALK